MPEDITGRSDIEALLTDRYGRVFADELLGPVFVDVAHMHLPTHIPAMCDFWQTVLLRTGSYRRNAFAPHQRLHAITNLGPHHFACWLALWQQTWTTGMPDPRRNWRSCRPGGSPLRCAGASPAPRG